MENSTRGMTNSGTEQLAWVQNIANLYYDPRPPVFVVTNPFYPNNYDFRFYVDINRNGRFETNGYQTTFSDENRDLGQNAVLNGEPEYIGVLKNPLQHHSSSNQFIGRYAYLVLPIGKTLDFNYIHNFLKATYGKVGKNNILTNSSVPTSENDGFARDQGIGSWELNLAGVLDAVSPWAYENNNLSYGPTGYTFGKYVYVSPEPGLYDTGLANLGNAFDDAEAILHYRYLPPYYSLAPLNREFTNSLTFSNNLIDIYCANALTEAPFDYNESNYPYSPKWFNLPWPGSYQTNLFFDVQDLFDPTKTSGNFTNRMILASQRTNTFDRYTFQRLLSCIGMESSPEYGVWVYANAFNPVIPPLMLRTKVNINYDNTSQITNAYAPYAPMPTNLVPWKPVAFFTNAADLLLRSQGYVYINYYTNNGLILYTITTNYCGVTNIPIYNASLPGVHYDATVHRMLQLAANIYDATSTNQSWVNGLPVRHPSVFRPVFQVFRPGTSNAAINIAGYVQVTNDAYTQMLKPFQEVTNVLRKTIFFDPNGNVAGIPWIVAANKGLPAFYQYACGSEVLLERKLKFPRPLSGGRPVTNQPPAYTNQFYCMAITNSIGMDAWNPYPNNFYGSNGVLYFYYSNYVTIQLTNQYNFGTNIVLAISNFPQLGSISPWKAGGGGVGSKFGFLSIFNSTNLISLPESYYSESQHSFYGLTNGDNDQNSFLFSDMTQTHWPVYNWTLNVTNHVVYALFDGDPRTTSAPLLDFVNLGPFGSSISITNVIATQINNPLNFNGGGLAAGSYWAPGLANSLPNSPMSQGVLNQIAEAFSTNRTFQSNLFGRGTGQFVFDCPCKPTYVIQQPTNWVANDPLVHYTIEDLTWTGGTLGLQSIPANEEIVPPFTNNLGKVSARYAPWGLGDGTISKSMLFKDPNIMGSAYWQFPTNKFPGVGWIGRVHRGTPWQTVYLKADPSLNLPQSYSYWSNWANPNWVTYPNAPETYPTNDWPLVDVFTTAPNDNAACGLLAVNQTNDAAWAAVFAGVIAPTNANFGIQIMPNNNGVLGAPQNFTNLVDLNSFYYGINAYRTNQPNGIFHKVGYILGASALTTTSPFLGGNAATVPDLTDEMVERIPQQTLSLLKVGEPQFVIFAWGQALKPKGPPFLGIGANANTYTNYEITGEFLTRTVCHLVHTNGLKMVIDSYNVESGN